MLPNNNNNNSNNPHSSHFYREQPLPNRNGGSPEANALGHLGFNATMQEILTGMSNHSAPAVSPQYQRTSPHSASGISPIYPSGTPPLSNRGISPPYNTGASPQSTSGMSPHYGSGTPPHSSGVSPHNAAGISPQSSSRYSPHSAAIISPQSSSGYSSHSASAMPHHLPSGFHHYSTSGYPFVSTSGHHVAHSSHYVGTAGHHGNPGPSGYHGHSAPAASHMHQDHQGHAGHALHPWYQSYHQAHQMQNVPNPYCMQNEQYNMWQHHPILPSNDIMEWRNLLHMNSAMSQHQQNYNQRLEDLSRLPSPTLTLSPSEHSSPGLENMAPPTPPNFPHGSNHPSNIHGANAIAVGSGGGSRNGGRSAINRSPYDWMRKSSYQSQPNPGKTRTKDKYRIVYTDNQRIELEKEFTFQNKYITIRKKTELAAGLGLSERQIKIWFQNRRAKERKQQKKEEEERKARLARSLNNYPALMQQAIEDPQLVNNPLPHGSRQLLQNLHASPISVTASGGILTPPSGSQDILQPSCSYGHNPPHHMPPHMDDDDDQGTAC